MLDELYKFHNDIKVICFIFSKLNSISCVKYYTLASQHKSILVTVLSDPNSSVVTALVKLIPSRRELCLAAESCAIHIGNRHHLPAQSNHQLPLETLKPRWPKNPFNHLRHHQSIRGKSIIWCNQCLARCGTILSIQYMPAIFNSLLSYKTQCTMIVC